MIGQAVCSLLILISIFFLTINLDVKEMGLLSNLSALLVVLEGTFAATLIAYPLKKTAMVILNHPDLCVEVHGYTDDRPIHNQRYPSNWELSLDRATQVARVLVNLGIQPANVSIKGLGENYPLYANDSNSNRLKNRRVEIQCSLRPSRA